MYNNPTLNDLNNNKLFFFLNQSFSRSGIRVWLNWVVLAQGFCSFPDKLLAGLCLSEGLAEIGGFISKVAHLHAWQINADWLHEASVSCHGLLHRAAWVSSRYDHWLSQNKWSLRKRAENMQGWSHNAYLLLSLVSKILSPPHYLIHWKLVTKSSQHAGREELSSTSWRRVSENVQTQS